MKIGFLVGISCLFMFLNTKLPETPDYSQTQQQLNKFLGPAPKLDSVIEAVENASERAQYYYTSPDTTKPFSNALNSILSGREIK